MSIFKKVSDALKPLQEKIEFEVYGKKYVAPNMYLHNILLGYPIKDKDGKTIVTYRGIDPSMDVYIGRNGEVITIEEKIKKVEIGPEFSEEDSEYYVVGDTKGSKKYGYRDVLYFTYKDNENKLKGIVEKRWFSRDCCSESFKHYFQVNDGKNKYFVYQNSELSGILPSEMGNTLILPIDKLTVNEDIEVPRIEDEYGRCISKQQDTLYFELNQGSKSTSFTSKNTSNELREKMCGFQKISNIDEDMKEKPFEYEVLDFTVESIKFDTNPSLNCATSSLNCENLEIGK